MKKRIEPTIAMPREELLPPVPDEETTNRLAYEFWRARGCPIGSPEYDWYAAEKQLKKSLTANAA